MAKTSLIIPTYNEEKTINNIIKHSRKYVDEIIIIVAKKSNDKTYEIARAIADKVLMDDGKGKGAALRIGVKNASHNIIIFMDADGSHDPKDIPKLLKPIMKNKADLVVGSRSLGGSEELHGTFNEFMRNVGGAIVMLCINYFFNVRFTDCENGFRAIKKKVFNELNIVSNDFDIEQEIFIKALKKGCLIYEVPTREYKRKFGESRLNVLKTGWKFVWCLRHIL